MNEEAFREHYRSLTDGELAQIMGSNPQGEDIIRPAMS